MSVVESGLSIAAHHPGKARPFRPLGQNAGLLPGTQRLAPRLVLSFFSPASNGPFVPAAVPLAPGRPASAGRPLGLAGLWPVAVLPAPAEGPWSGGRPEPPPALAGGGARRQDGRRGTAHVGPPARCAAGPHGGLDPSRMCGRRPGRGPRPAAADPAPGLLRGHG